MELSRFLDLPIEDETTYRAARDEVHRLVRYHTLTPEEADELRFLAERVSDYELRRFKLPDIPF